MDIKERKKLTAQKYYQNNKEKIIEKVKIYSQKNKDKKREYDKKYVAKNKEEIYKKNKVYYYENKDIINKKKRDCYSTEKSFNTRYKHITLLDGDFDRYNNSQNCEICNKKYTKITNVKCLDHCHHCNYLRNVCCSKCNIKLGVVDRIKNILHLEFYRYIIYNNIIKFYE
jgi:hypothetical protein